jgi:hypothetical protein
MTTTAKTKLPALKELYSDTELKVVQNELNVLLNNPPAKSWIKDHPYAKKDVIIDGKKVKVPLKYIAIERIEWLLTKIFIRWHVEIKTVQIIANAVSVTVRLYYQDVVTKEMLWQDGVGAMALQVDSGAGAIEFDKIKSSAVMIAAPAAETYAVKDAAEKIGKIFGKDLNRKDEIGYDNLLNTFETQGDETRNRKAGYDEELIRKSTYDDDMKEILYDKIGDANLPFMEYKKIMKEVEMNQPKKY